MITERSAKILIVDDTRDNANLLERLVRRMMGHEAVVAHSGAQGLKLIDSEQFDLVILDIIMPQMDGLAVLEEIRKRYDMQQLPVMLLSARSNTRDITEGLKNGANDYITKPLTLSIIRVRIETQLRLKSLADERLKLLSTLQNASAAQTQLMRIASHDLKNPLHSLKLILALLEPELEDNTEVVNYLSMAMRHTDAMESIISYFLELDLLRDDTVNIEYEPLMITDLVDDVVRDFRYMAEKKGVEFNIDIEPGIVRADSRQLRQALANLISNGIKYTQPGTVIRITGHVEGDMFVLHVIDQGEGIPPQEAKLLFKPFSKLTTKPTAGESSTGLGLWIVKHMIEMQEGSVGINEAYRDGADFWIRIPLVPEVTNRTNGETAPA